MTLARTEVKKENQWNVEAIYPDLKAWQKDFDALVKEGNVKADSILAYRGKLGDGADVLKKAIEESIKLERKLSVLYTYAHLKHDEDIAEPEHKAALSKIRNALNNLETQLSWFEPELIALDEAKIKSYLESKELKDYRFHLEKTFRQKPHTLPYEQERLISLSSLALSTPHKAFSSMNDADLKFGEAIDSHGKSYPLTHGSYQVLLRSQDRELRKNAFTTYHSKFESFENTMAELLNGAVQRNVFNARARNFKSSLDAALFPNHIDTGVYKKLIETVKANLQPLFRYFDVRKKMLKLDEIHLYDMAVPLTPSFDLKVTYPEAEELLIKSFAPLGPEYVKEIEKGLKNDRWVDRYENQNKRSGAYSSGCYDTNPYILMNYKDILRDVFTLAHEAGHSMHSLLSRKHQPYQYGNYPIFLAEVASTFNEELLNTHLLNKSQNKEEQIFLISQKLDDIRATLFRQTMFAEFELKIHEMAENNIPLTPQALKALYIELTKSYFGPHVVIDKEIEIEWARIPHFYYNFYVFQYATGISAALALANRVLKGGAKEREAYLGFLKSGSSDYPIETLEKAGVDMSSPAPVKEAIDYFGNLVDKLSSLTK